MRVPSDSRPHLPSAFAGVKVGVLLVLAMTGCALLFASLPSCGRERPADKLRVGFYPNVTHAQALLGVPTGMLGQYLPPGVTLDPKVFSSGPALVEALYAGSIDVGYIGPNPALNGFIHSHGEAFRIVAGASSGGAVFVVRGDSGIETPDAFHGKKVGTPQLGNTQDVALRTWLNENGLAPVEKGGDVRILPLGYPEIFSLFKRRDLDAAWVAEPWGARLELEAGARVFLDERYRWQEGRFVTAHVIVRKDVLEQEPALVKSFLKGHVRATRRFREDPKWAEGVMGDYIEKLTRQRLEPAVLERAMTRVEVTWDPIPSSLMEAARAAQELGFLETANVHAVYDLGPLNEVLRAQGLQEVRLP